MENHDARSEFPTFIDVLEHRCMNQGDQVAYSVIDGKLDVIEQITYEELKNKAIDIAVLLQSQNLIKGDRCILVMHSPIDFITGFLGCMMAGVISVSVYPPRKNRINKRFLNILENTAARAILTTKSLSADLEIYQLHRNLLLT